MRGIRGAVVGGVGLLAGACATPVIVNPSWAELPAPEDMADAYPGFASLAGIHGTAALSCLGLPDGRLAACDVISATPAGLGFDRAAVRLAPRFRLSPRTVDGEASKARIQFRVVFSLSSEVESWTPYEGPAPDEAEVAQAQTLAVKMYEYFMTSAEEQRLELGVDEDRRADVERILDEADAEFRQESLDAIALGLARVLTPEQIDAMTEGRELDEPPPPFEDFVRASAPDNRDTGDPYVIRLQQKYCALYPCEPKPPGR